MYCPTADAVTSIRFRRHNYALDLAREAEKIERHVSRFWKFGKTLSENQPDRLVYAHHIPIPAWLDGIERKIRESIIPFGEDAPEGGRWLRKESADSAIAFFRETADLWAIEPFVYGSTKGDLIAEFGDKKGPLTVIISPDFALLFAAIGETPLEVRLTDREKYREGIENLNKRLGAAEHGTLGTPE
jgi:hypothetical protein